MKPAPGSYKIVTHGGKYVLRGSRLDGSAVRVPCATRGEAERLADTLFRPAPVVPLAVVDGAASPSSELDDWGLPRVSPATVASVAAAVGAKPAQEQEQAKDAPPVQDEVERKRKAQELEEVQKKRRKYAATFSELLGSGLAMGVGMAARKTRDPEKYEIARPNPKHLSDLADCSAEGIKESFGDREIGPWTMTFMLSVGIILSVWFQSSPKKLPAKDQRPLQSVP